MKRLLTLLVLTIATTSTCFAAEAQPFIKMLSHCTTVDLAATHFTKHNAEANYNGNSPQSAGATSLTKAEPILPPFHPASHKAMMPSGGTYVLSWSLT